MSMLQELFEGSEPLNERPYSRTQSAIDSAKGGVKGLFGSGQVEQGAQESGRIANQLWIEFKRMIGRKYGKPQQAVPYADVYNFFKSSNLDTSELGTNKNRYFSPKDVGNALLQAAREQTTAQYKSDEEPEQQNAPASQPQQQAPKSEPVNNPKEEPASTSAPDSLEGKLASLSAQERNQLLAMLS